MPPSETNVTSIDALVLETRAIREAVHGLVSRLREERRIWASELETLSRRSRLTTTQRQRLRAQLDARRLRR